MSKFLKSFGKKIKDCRELRHYTQEELAYSMNIATTTLSAWENGKTFPKYESLQKLCKTLKIQEENLFIMFAEQTGNSFIDQLNDIALQIPPARHKQVIQILKTFVE